MPIKPVSAYSEKYKVIIKIDNSILYIIGKNKDNRISRAL